MADDDQGRTNRNRVLRGWNQMATQSGPQPRWQTAVTINAPTFPANYLPGGLPAAQPVRLLPPAYYQHVPQHNIAVYNYPDPFADATAMYAPIPVTYAAVPTPAVNVHPAPNVAVTYVHTQPIATYSGYTMPMPDVPWSQQPRRQGRQQASEFQLDPQLTSQQETHLMTTQPRRRQRLINSLPELEATVHQPSVTQSERSIDVQGIDPSITSQTFTTLAYGSQIQSQASALTVHGSIQNIEEALLCMPKYPHTVFSVQVNTDRMEIMDNWTQTNKKRQIHIQNFYRVVTESDPNDRLIIETSPSGQAVTVSATTSDVSQPTTAPPKVTAQATAGATAASVPTTTAKSELDVLKERIEKKDEELDRLRTLLYDFHLK